MVLQLHSRESTPFVYLPNRFAHPLLMTEEQLMECVAIIDKTLAEFKF
jgi:hypothetical protein